MQTEDLNPFAGTVEEQPADTGGAVDETIEGTPGGEPAEDLEKKDEVKKDEPAADLDDEFSKLKPETDPTDPPFEGKIEGVYLKLPKGMKSDAAELKEFIALAKEGGTKPEVIQKFVDFSHRLQGKFMDNVADMDAKFRMTLNNKWISENKQDAEFGGNNYEASVNYAMKALRKFVPKNELLQTEAKDGKMGFLEFIDRANLRNCPPMFKLLVRIGKSISESSPTPNPTPKRFKPAVPTMEDAVYGGIK